MPYFNFSTAGSVAHPASYPVGTRDSFPGLICQGQGIRGAVPPLTPLRA